MRVFSLLAALLVMGFFALGTRSWPDPSSPDSPVRLHVSPRILERADLETGRSGPVPALLWDYRSVDAWILVFSAFGVMMTFSAVARGFSRTSASGPEFAEDEIHLLAACVAAGAWMLGTIPIFRGGAFLNTECLPQWVGPEHLRAAASWAWELAAVISVLCAVLIMFRILRRRGETR